VTDDELLSAFETGRVPDAFPHAEHVRVGWLSVRRYGRDEAADRVAAGIRRVADAAGAPGKFHETITRAWIYLIAAAVSRCGAREFDAFTAANPELLDTRLLARHYTAAALERGRARWVAPDLEPIPGAPAA
jgi:hypothetical protein